MKRIFIVILFFLSGHAMPAYAEKINVAVIYPESTGAYAKVYEAILKGIESDGISVKRKAYASDQNPEKLSQWLHTKNIVAVIALGKTPTAIFDHIQTSWPVIMGGTTLDSNDHAGVSLVSDPDLMFQQLVELKPQISQVHVVYRPSNNEWLIEIAKISAKKHGIQLKTYAVHNHKSAVIAYKKLLNEAQAFDGIWLPIDPSIPMKTILPELLSQAWHKQLLLFSNNPIDVKRGVLFALFPDYAPMGTQIAHLASQVAQQPRTSALNPVRHVKSALNTRTAMHLGLDLSSADRRQFDLIYPRK